MSNHFTNVDILLIEDDEFHMNIIKQKLKAIGLKDLKCVKSFREASDYLESYLPDIVIADFYLDHGHTSSELVKDYLLNKNIPVIFVSSFYGNDVLNEIVDFALVDFLPKNLTEFDLQKSIEIALAKKRESTNNSKLKEFMFVKLGKDIKKVALADIKYIEVENKYLNLIVSENKKYLVRSTLNDFYKKLPDNFLKIHQAFIINLKYLDSIQLDENLVTVSGKSLPFSRSFKKDLLTSYYFT